MQTRHIIKKQLSYLPCKFILGVIAPPDQLNPSNALLLEETQRICGKVERILPEEPLEQAPPSYIQELGSDKLSTVILIMENQGSFTDLYHLKKNSMKLESKLSEKGVRRTFNINPGALGTYGLSLASHKSTGGRPEIGPYLYGLHPHLGLFTKDLFYERIMRWNGSSLGFLAEGAHLKFPEYTNSSRVDTFNNLVHSLDIDKRSVELR